jgi:hypothetical protein
MFNNIHFLETQSALYERRKVSVHKALEPSISLHGRGEGKSLTELTVICVTAGEWGKPTGQSCGLSPIHSNPSQKCLSNRIETDDDKMSTFQTLRLYCTWPHSLEQCFPQPMTKRSVKLPDQKNPPVTNFYFEEF